MEELESYRIRANELDLEVTIARTDAGALKYFVVIPFLNPGTMALLEHIKSQLITSVAVTSAEVLEPKALEALKLKFRQQAAILMKSALPSITDDTLQYLLSVLIQETLGLDKLEYLINDDALEEIVVVSSHEPIRVFHKRHGWLITNLVINSESQVQNIANIIARRVGRQVTTLTPLLDAHLVTGDRVNVVLSPVSSKGNTITIRRFARDPWTMTDFLKNGTVEVKMLSLMWLAIQYEMNMLISGGTASGKTTIMNICMPFIPPTQRILSIEDTREINLPKFLYWCPLVTRDPNPEGKGEVSMLDLLINALRMRPDRIILGEMRKKDQAQVLFEAMHTGHSVYSTVHADSLQETIDRLTHPPIEVPPNLLEAVNLNVVMFRDRRKRIRRVYQVGEFLVSEENGRSVARPNLIYRWKPGEDKIVPHNKPVHLFEELSRRTGMSLVEIHQDLLEKRRILQYMVDNNIRELNRVGEIMNRYYFDKDDLLKELKLDKKTADKGIEDDDFLTGGKAEAEA
ncbi:MAG TPA: ATPase, T2SS/T4P/T4SS family [Candidatus Nanoarchaeia archaeon]|nr:ATPase, T2SS/T4P/T4SS family [Candidatus Nanoarchaeia archaeon]